MPLPLRHADLYHTGIVVADLEAAKAEFAEALGVTWGFGSPNEMPVWLPNGPRTVLFNFVYTNEGPHRLELVQAIEDSVWDVTPPGHAHHVGYWCDDVVATSAALTASGAPCTARIGASAEDEPAVAVMHRLPSGLHVEALDRAMKEMMFGPD
jgi:catechol 2,3-dioxygenase-like lactoylglutathione lyase family enzyme